MVTLTYDGSPRVMPNYNVMGVAKAALEARCAILPTDLGRDGSASTPCPPVPCAPSPDRPSRARAITYGWQGKSSPLRRNVDPLSEVGNAGLYLLSDLSAGRHRRGPFRRQRLPHVIGMAVPGGA
jgi:enoyl-[acyl-carrier-protein] reductase (NADH)